MLARAREFFAEKNILEVDTPILSRFAVSDPHIESAKVTMQLDSRSNQYLRTSPEHCMKRLLSSGYPDIYEIGKVFRDGEVGRHHQPEFTLVEWYRLNFRLRDMMHETLEFIARLLGVNRLREPPAYLSYSDAFSKFAGFDPFTIEIDSLSELAHADEQLEKTLGLGRDDWLNLVLAERISRQFPPDRLTVLYHYPASQAALARHCPDDPAVADRFEVFAGMLELANGYVELLDAKEQLDRFVADQTVRQQAGKAQRPIDELYIAALESGLPPCAGVAVGFDRVHMLNEGSDDIRRTLNFPFQIQGDGA